MNHKNVFGNYCFKVLKYWCFNIQGSFLLSGEGSCTVWSSDGPVVKRGSTFRVYCSFKYRCTGTAMYSHDPETHQRTLQRNMKFNSTTVYFEVVNITRNQTYSCSGKCHLPMDDCGLDMAAGCKCETRISLPYKASVLLKNEFER